MAGLCEGGNEPPGSLKAKHTTDEGLGKLLKCLRSGRSIDKTNGGNAREDVIRMSEGMKRLPDISDCEDRMNRALERLLAKKKSAKNTACLAGECAMSAGLQTWFMHDGTPAHSLSNVREHLTLTFQDSRIGRGSPTPWPARSPNLNL
ncbi:hypothetical protein ANN_18004 [Periplaneta americana]|uniref:Uncharacterized protein n=1 Tax=Periplaneta americana TaxID=6978 RepID=A0ABQ8SMI9_PERAM|nr:hypothetical protein ANN_18004 [Periplaneta americana]